MKHPVSPRILYLAGFVMTTVLLGIAWYLQKQDGLNPCPLCALQRLLMAFLGITFFFGAVLTLKKVGQLLIGTLSFLIAFLGLILSGRQVWLQHFPPPGSADCGVSLQYLFHVFPFDEAIKKVFTGGIECSQVNWQFLHLSIAEWALISFAIFMLLTIFQLMRAQQFNE